MKIKKEKLHENFKRDTYWTRIYFESEDKERKSVVLVCVSEEYIWDLFGAREPEKVKLEQWLEGIVKKWDSLSDKIFDKEIHYDVYTNTPEGMTNGLEFLQKEIKP